MADHLTSKQSAWTSLYDAYDKRKTAIELLLTQAAYKNPTTQINQQLRLELLNTEYALRKHFEGGQKDPALFDLAQERLAKLPSVRQDTIGVYKYDNLGSTPFLAPELPQAARAQWELDLVQRAKDVATQIADTYNTDVAPYVIETVRQLGAFFIDRSKYIPAPSKLPGLPKTGHAPTDELGGGLLDETIKKATGIPSAGDVVMDKILGPRPGTQKPQDPLKLMYNNILNDETIAEAANTLAQLEAAYGGEISYSADTGIFTIAKQSGDFVYRANISIQENGTALVSAPAQIAGHWVEATYQFDPASRSMAPLAVTAVDGYAVSAAEAARVMGDLYAAQLVTEVLDPVAASGSIDLNVAAALLEKIYEASATRLLDGGFMVLASTDNQLVGANPEFRRLRDAMLDDPTATIEKTAEGNIVITAQGQSNLLTPDGIILKVNPADSGTSVSIDILTGARAGFTINTDSAAPLTPDQLAALSKAISSGSSAGLTGSSFQGLADALQFSLQHTATGDSYGNFTVVPVVGDSGERIGTTFITQYTENNSAVRIETTTYADVQRVRETWVIGSNQNGQEIRALYANGRFQGLTQINGAAVSAGLNELFVSALKARGIENPTPEDVARVNQSLGDAAGSRDIALQEALAAIQGEAVIGTDYYGNPTYISKTEANLQTVSNGVGSLIDALSLIKAIQSGQPLPIVASGLRLAADLDYLDGTRDLPGLGAAASIAGSVLSLYGLANALERGDGVGAITSAAYAVKGAADAAAFLQTSGLISEVPVGLQAAGQLLDKALPYLNLVNSIAQGDATGTAVAVVDLVMINAGVYSIPYIGWAYAVYSIVSSLFGDEDAVPDPWGSGRYVWNGSGISYQSAGETGGNEAVANVMASVLSTMNALIERERQQNPGSQLGIIPNRMPSVGYDMSGYRYTDLDPLTGAEQHPALRFDTAGRPYNAEAGSPESYQSIVEGMVRSALSRGAIAPLWEVQTARLQTEAGDPKAGLTEEERAGRDGQLAAPLTGATQTFRPVALDLDNDGIETVAKAQGVAFDVDDSGYLKQTGWIQGDDAFLVLDRDYNGNIDSGRELFSNATVALGRRGLAGLAWVDANYDGKLTAADPVWNELKVWRDADQDGVEQAGETQSLAALGVTELNYAMGTFTRNGQQQQLASPDLDADTQGTRVSVVPEGILVQASENGRLSLLVTRIDDQTAVEANRDGIGGYEDVELIVSTADLLANDSLGGFAGRELTITGLTNFRHGSGFIDANGFVHFTPEANYAGEGAGFDYTVRATNGQEGTATVDITLQNVNDAPTLHHVDHTTRPVYGYVPVQYTPTDGWGGGGQYVSGGNSIYEPYAIRREWNAAYGDYTEIIVYNPPANQWDLEYHTTPIATEDSGAGRVNGADEDDPASSLAYELVNQPQYGAVSLNADGTFQYTSWKEPGIPSDYIVVNGQYVGIKDGALYEPSNLPSQAVYPTTDVFQVRITDPQGATTIQSITVPHYGPYLPPTPPGGGGGGKKPIAVDLDGNGFEFINVDDSNVFFDVNGDGWKRRTAWVGKDDGLLAYDIDGDGKIDKPGEISFARYQDGAQSDLDGLAAFDSDGDGIFSAADAKWSRFGVWQDANQNGVTDAGEFRTLTEMGVAAVNLTSDGKFEVINGQTVRGVGAMAMADGSRLAIADVTLAYSNETQVPQSDGTTQTVNTSPFSPSGELLEGTEDKDLILGKNGNNIVKAYGGDDVIFEDGGNDLIDGGAGDDLIYAGADNDLVMGGDGDDALYAGLGSDVVFGGDGHDAIFAEGGNDIVFGGAGNDLMSGGAGNDVLSGDEGDDQVYGESGNDALFGRDGNDELLGMDGADRLDGGAGNDLLDGGTGADEMSGGAGDDIYGVDDAGDTVTELAGAGSDTVRASLDGYVLGANLENLTLTGSANLSGSGNELDNTLIGNRGNNVLSGGAGNDVLDGALGADTLVGGSGDDTYGVDNTGDTVAENVDEGIDTVKASVGYALAANLENLTLTGTASIDAAGNELDNRLLGNAADNVLDGGAGADFLAGGRGNDTYVVDQAGDGVVELANEGIDTVVSGISYTLGTNVENLILSGTADLSGGGNELDNVLVGNAGRNVLDGAAGADTLAGGAGDDTYVVDNAGDTVTEAADAGTDTVLSGVSYALSANVENLILTGTADVAATGNEIDNLLAGNAGNNVLDGGAGADAMAGGGGDDTYLVDHLGDTVVEAAAAGVDSVFSSVRFVLPEYLENLALTGSAAIDGTGNGLDNLLSGNDAANVLDGAAGADRMIGGGGDDIYSVDNAADRVEEAAGGGYDTVRTTISLSAPEHVERVELLGADDLDATGNALDNVLVGNSGANRLDGGLGADVMAGGAGDDSYVVDDAGDTVVETPGEGMDAVRASVSHALAANVDNLILTGAADIGATGNELANVLTGNDGNNVLDGGAGADAMSGGAGDDTYVVDNAADTVWEAAGAGLDGIYASVSYVLPENVENLYLAGDGAIGAGGNGADNVLIGNGADNVISGGGGNDTLDGRAGNDTLEGGNGSDVLLGGEGNDLLVGGTGADQLDGGAGDDTYVIDPGDGLDRIVDGAGADTVRFGAGLTLDNVALRVTRESGLYTARVRVLEAGGCEQADQGFDFAVTVDRSGSYVSPIEKFQFADGSVNTFDDLLIKTRVTFAAPWDQAITTGRDDDIILAGSRNDTVRSGSGNDIVFAGSGGDTVYGEGGDDYLQGGTGNDTLDGGCGVDVLAGSEGRDSLRDMAGNNALFGGQQNDRIEAGAGNDFIAGGKHDDTIQAGGGANVITFNRGDGRDTVLPAAGASNTLSLGGGIDERDLSLRKSGQDLVFATGGGSQVTFQDWYAAADNQNFVTLQVVEAVPYSGRGHADPGGREIETYDFKTLVQRFDAARAADPKLSQWSLMNGLLDAHLASSDSAALGGELATRYAAGGDSAISLGVAADTLKDAHFGSQAQSVGSRFEASVSAYRLG